MLESVFALAMFEVFDTPVVLEVVLVVVLVVAPPIVVMLFVVYPGYTLSRELVGITVMISQANYRVLVESFLAIGSS